METRYHIEIKGAVQGVGFRPFVYRIAHSLNLKGYVSNNTQGVVLDIQGSKANINEFLIKLKSELPPNASIDDIICVEDSLTSYQSFEIRESSENSSISAVILPDIAICKDCKSEMFNPSDRRYLYPFINCTNCGPRYSIIEKLPYDRCNTSMRHFNMCEECRQEYNDPLSRRFHAQPIACPVCGPTIELYSRERKLICKGYSSLKSISDFLKDGKIIAVKGIGGYQLICDASNDIAVETLRLRKHRYEKPFAMMFHSIEDIKQICEVLPTEEKVLDSPESPIVLLKKLANPYRYISELISPDNNYLGIMLPYSPLHMLIMSVLNNPIVATSGNISEEPICISEDDAFEALYHIADYFLIHNRKILRYVDDSVVQVVKGKVLVLRRARGYAPFPISIDSLYKNKKLLATGGHYKNSVSIKIDKRVFISQHIGDLSNEKSFNAFKKVVKDLSAMYKVRYDTVIKDCHPDYISSKYADSQSSENYAVQHHIAHIAACRLEHSVKGEALGVAWDGTGYGLDKTIWGGEFFHSDDNSFRRIGYFSPFPLPGGEQAIREPRRSVIGALYNLYGTEIFERFTILLNNLFSELELSILKQILEKRINTPFTSSVGRLFDAVSSLLNLCTKVTYEGQAAIKLESIIEPTNQYYSFYIENTDGILIIKWEPLIEEIISDLENGISRGIISAKFHNTLVEIIVEMVGKLGYNQILISGGCFQNIYLLERTIDRLEKSGCKIFWNQQVPINDGGISFGQIAAYLITENFLQNNK
ncbi:MAG: carbamoyltransferase HypF [Ignavibacteria bacterium]